MAWGSRRKRDRKRFGSPSALLASEQIEGTARERMRKLERIYSLAHHTAWDGKQVLDGLLVRHGGIQLAPEHREALARVFSVILWGELAAWAISAEIAEGIDDVEAKMAATSQAFDEARHFYTMRDYLRALDVPVPPLDAYARLVLRELLATDSLVYKLVGMQLLVENAALSIFKMVAAARIEPVLSDLMPYFEKDEARHVGLGVNYLPTLLSRLSTWEVVKLNVFQGHIYAMLFWDTMMLFDDFTSLGLDANESTRFSLRLQVDIATQMGKFASDSSRRREGRGVYVEPDFIRRTHSFSVDAFMPHPGAAIPGWQRAVLGAAKGVARAGARCLDVVDPA